MDLKCAVKSYIFIKINTRHFLEAWILQILVFNSFHFKNKFTNYLKAHVCIFDKFKAKTVLIII